LIISVGGRKYEIENLRISSVPRSRKPPVNFL
jgi:hypothetical protein